MYFFYYKITFFFQKSTAEIELFVRKCYLYIKDKREVTFLTGAIMIKKSVLMLFFVLFFAGCRSDIYYQNRAAERARKYLLENCENLSVDEMYFVRYNAPVLLHAPLLGKYVPGRKEKLNSYNEQICVTWIIPGRDELFMVFGVSRPRMDDWFPNRMLIRNYKSHVPAMVACSAVARKYLQNNFFNEMSDDEIYQVRFSFPYLMRTGFDLNFNPDGKLNEMEIAGVRSEAGEKIQYSLVWKLPKRNLAVVGLADKGMKNWSIKMADFVGEKELQEKVIATVLTPDEGLFELPEEE